MPFTFAFEEDDSDERATSGTKTSPPSLPGRGSALTPIPAVEHSLDELLSTLPDRISYNTVSIESPTGRLLLLPRRELYDVRVQLIAEDEPANDEILKDISNSDIRSGVYEGGFKTWECSLDLASLLLDRGPRKDIDELCQCDQIIELGCGTGIPTLVLFQHALRNDIALTFTVSDYNDAVIRLITLPNLLLTWAMYDKDPVLSAEAGPDDLEIDAALLQRFKQRLSQSGIDLNFLTGSWSSSHFVDLVPMSAPDMGTVILAAETIYSQTSTAAFVKLVVDLLRRTKMSKAIVAAKRFYFGVGGSLDGLKEACREHGAIAYEIENSGVPGMDMGVGRALVEIQMY